MDNPDPNSPILASFKLLLFSQCSFTNVYIGLALRVYRIGVYLYTYQALSIMCVCVCVCVHEGAASGVEERGVEFGVVLAQTFFGKGFSRGKIGNDREREMS